jgi:hypothetical protein
LIAKSNATKKKVTQVPALSKKIAQRFLADFDSVDLSEFTSIESSAAEVLSKFGGILALNGLTSLADAAAQKLSHHEGQLELNGLTTLSDGAARRLVEYQGNVLALDGLKKPSDAMLKGFLSSGSVTNLSLGGLSSLSESQLDILSQYQWNLSLNGLKTLSVRVAERLGKHKTGLELNGLKNLSDKAAEVLCKLELDQLILDGLTSLSDTLANNLSKHPGRLSLNGVTSLSDAAAKRLSKHKGWLSLNGLTVLSSSVAESLAQHWGNLDLAGLRSLTDNAAKGLSKHHHVFSIDLSGLTTLTDEAASRLVRHQGHLDLRGLRSPSAFAAERLKGKPGSVCLDEMCTVTATIRQAPKKSAKKTTRLKKAATKKTAQPPKTNASPLGLIAPLVENGDWYGVIENLPALHKKNGRTPGLMWRELFGDLERPSNPKVFSLEDDVWQACLDQLTEKLHPDTGLAAKIVVTAIAATGYRPDELRSLDIVDAELDDISPLVVLSKLRSLTIDQSESMPGPLRDISPLGLLKELCAINLTCGVDDLSPLASLPKLRELYLIYCDNITDVGPLTRCDSLKVICIDSCEGIGDVSAFADSKRLKELTLRSLENASGLEALKKFKGRLILEDMGEP